MGKAIKVQEMTVGRETFCVVRKSDYEKLARKAEGPYVDAVEFANQSIGRSLRRKRVKAGLKQADVAAKAGIRIETLSRIESGKGNPTVATVKAVLKALGEPING